MNLKVNHLIRDLLYARLLREVIAALKDVFGLPINDITRARMHAQTYPIVSRGRGLLSNMVYRDYKALVGKDPVPQVPMNRFTEELWRNSIEKSIGEASHVTVTVTRDIGMSADYWSRDAEWGQQVQLAGNDPRVGRIARIDREPPTCPLCTLMNSRGPVYTTESFLRTLHIGDTCEPVFVLRGETTYPGMEHTAEALRRYKEAVSTLGPHERSANNVMNAIRAQNPESSPGKVWTAANTDSENIAGKKASDARKQLASLEKSKPKSPRAQTLRDEQITRITQLLSVLETK